MMIVVLYHLILLQIKKVWQMNTAFSSIATNKQSPYGIFLKSAINEMRKNGLLDRLSKKWSEQDNSCDSLTKSGRSLSVEKSITIFLILAFGAVFGDSNN